MTKRLGEVVDGLWNEAMEDGQMREGRRQRIAQAILQSGVSCVSLNEWCVLVVVGRELAVISLSDAKNNRSLNCQTSSEQAATIRRVLVSDVRAELEPVIRRAVSAELEPASRIQGDPMGKIEDVVCGVRASAALAIARKVQLNGL